MKNNIIFRSFDFVPEVPNDNKLSGYAAKFNKTSYNERILPGAFTKTLNENKEIVLLWNHDSNFPLARVSADTLSLREDGIGLFFEANLNDSTKAQDAIKDVRSGNIKGMSFGFYPIKTRQVNENNEVINELQEVYLREISLVTFPWYEDTEVYNRSLELGMNFKDLLEAIQTNNQEVILRHITALQKYVIKSDETPESDIITTNDNNSENHFEDDLELLKLKLNLLEME